MFRRVFTINEHVYNITVFGAVTNVYFSMFQCNGVWTFKKPELVATWIREIEAELHSAIENHHVLKN